MRQLGRMVIGAALLAATAVQAGPLSDVLFRPGAFARTSGVTRYVHARQGAVTPGGPAEMQGVLVVTPRSGPSGAALALSETVGGAERPVAEFPASGGDPVLLWFLETTVRSMAAVTEGSPFYIRNRLREALAAADLGPGAGEVTTELRPFARDPNRARMGSFGDLVLRITLDPGQPVPLRALSADTTAAGGTWRETLTLETP